MLAGGIAAQHNRVLINSDHCLTLFVASAILILLRRSRPIGLLLFGFTFFVQAGNQIIEARLEPMYSGDSMLARVRVIDFPKQNGASLSLLLQPLDDARLPGRFRVSWFDAAQVPALGEVWQLELRLRRPRGLSNPGGFNLENWMFREHLHAGGYVVPGKRNRLLEASQAGPVARQRQAFVNFAAANGGDSAGILVAIGVGSRHLLSRLQWDRYAKTGTSHLMAISGLHIGLAATTAFAIIVVLSAALRLRGSHLDRGMIGAALVASAYALIAGFAVPSQRAVMMLTVLAVTFVARRRAEPLRVVALAALLVFLLDPVSLMKPGFALSFVAVAVLIRISNVYWRPLSANRRLSSAITAIRQLTAMQAALLLALTPLTVLFFQRIAVFAPVVNFIAVPVFSVVTVPLTLASLVLHNGFESLASIAIRVAAESIVLIEQIIAVFSSLALADTAVAASNLHPLLALSTALWVILPRGWPLRWIAILSAVAIILYKPLTPSPTCFDLHVLDVGQGLAVIVRSDRRTLLYDTGASFRDGGSVAEQVILPFLRFKGIDVIDRLVISHGDNDHAGGSQTILANTTVFKTYTGEAIDGLSGDVQACIAGKAWQEDGIEYQFLHPQPGSRATGNDASCVLSVAAGEHSVLLTGDIEIAAERQILAHNSGISADVVVVPHHGSLTSSSPPFVNRIRPDLALVSAGFENRWGFPKARVVKRWEGVGAVVLDTAEHGAISLEVCARSGISQLRQQRQLQGRFWHDAAP